jgi:hypothetical protein
MIFPISSYLPVALKVAATMLFSAMAASLIAVMPEATAPVRAAAEIPVPVTFAVPITVIVAWIASIAVGLTGIAVIWRFIMRASVLINDISQYGPVLVTIAKEFKSDSGSTLRDAINRLEEGAADAKEAAELAKKSYEYIRHLERIQTEQ